MNEADNKILNLNEPGFVTVIISSNQDTQKLTRDTGKLLDSFQGLERFRELVLVDLRNSVGNLLSAFVRMQMRQNLDKEAQRITPFFVANRNHQNPRLFTHAVPDFDGKISDSLGWFKPDENVRILVFDIKGEISFRWQGSEDPNLLKTKVGQLLQ